jgi:predicted nucleic acid-binding protein
MTSSVCLDASVFVKVLVQEDLSDVARCQWERWTCTERKRIVVPALFHFEVIAVLRKKVHLGHLALEEGDTALSLLLEASIETVSSAEIHRRAWQIARELSQPTAYDAHYLALAELERCAFWTADRRLYNSAESTFSFIHWLGDAPNSR